MRGKTIAEAELEVELARVFRRQPADWASRMLSESGSGAVNLQALTEAGFADADAEHVVGLFATGRFASLEASARHALTWNHQGMRTRFAGASIEKVTQKISESLRDDASGNALSTATFVDGKRVQ